MKILYHGHSSVEIDAMPGSLIIDPFISGNPLSRTKVEDVMAEFVLLTHGHADHTGDAIAIAKQNDATIIAIYELAMHMEKKGAKAHGMNIGGSAAFAFGRVQMTQAFHSAGYLDEEGEMVYAGMPAGLLLTIGDKTIYHAGDTSLFSDMQLFGSKIPIDLAFLPIGDTFTMGPEDAVQAAEWLNAKLVVPIHYNTFPPIQQDAEQFVQKLAEKGIEGRVLLPGEHMTL